jgi:hypothetical protein
LVLVVQVDLALVGRVTVGKMPLLVLTLYFLLLPLQVVDFHLHLMAVLNLRAMVAQVVAHLITALQGQEPLTKVLVVVQLLVEQIYQARVAVVLDKQVLIIIVQLQVVQVVQVSQ